ncbi:xanthine dehydrogenase accessory protein XdhC [Oleiphilus sp. HI0118]|nr:xanthine dehydrogenase accessory protein XdhC [Oleiphilus sp. HI0118]KZZ50889.1 xanthine dehydrogenase accessory protein XdhC [Oleiphilus sp. HI0118]
MMRSHTWFDAVKRCQDTGSAYALVTILGCTGSTPRDNSSKMVVTNENTYDTIGGGHLEFVVTNKARELLVANNESQEIHHFPLGASLGQCCGGSATVLIETFAACRFHIGLFGAGHVAKELVKILGALPCRVTWIDPREDLFPDELPANITNLVSDEPQYEIEHLPAGSDILILTHNHALDFELCMAALEHGKLRHIGLIGSDTKAERFVKRLAHRGYSEEQINSIKSPVGLSEIPGKLPMEVAVSIAGELIALQNSDKHTKTRRGLAWKDIKQELGGEIDSQEQGYRLNIEQTN